TVATTAYASPMTVDALDLDADGRPELVTANGSATITVLPNATPAVPVLTAQGITPGSPGLLRVTGATPGSTVFFGTTTAGLGAGPCPAIVGGHCADLLTPTVFGQAVA